MNEADAETAIAAINALGACCLFVSGGVQRMMNDASVQVVSNGENDSLRVSKLAALHVTQIAQA